jgi:hypothetical protein
VDFQNNQHKMQCKITTKGALDEKTHAKSQRREAKSRRMLGSAVVENRQPFALLTLNFAHFRQDSSRATEALPRRFRRCAHTPTRRYDRLLWLQLRRSAILAFPLRLFVTCRPLRFPLAFFSPEVLKPFNLFWSENRRQLSQFLTRYISLTPTEIPSTKIPFPSAAPTL